MGIYINGVEMPKDGYKTVYIHSNGCIYEPTSDNLIWDTVGKAIHVPPHGRLIDADALTAQGYSLAIMRIDEIDTRVWRELVPFDYAPTIIPADKEADK